MLRQAICSSAAPTPKRLTAAIVGGLSAAIAHPATATRVYSPNKCTSDSDNYVTIFIPASGALTYQVRDLDSYIAGWHGNPAANAWHFEIAKEIRALASKVDGWKGENSRAPSRSAVDRAQDLLRKLSDEKVERRPTVGLDHEGTFSFMWLDDEVRADLTVYDDGTYSFFAKGPKSARRKAEVLSFPPSMSSGDQTRR